MSVKHLLTHLGISIFLIYSCKPSGPVEQNELEHSFNVEVIADSIQVPFGMAFLPDTNLLVTDRASGKLWRIDVKRKSKSLIKGTPGAYCNSDGGLLDVLLHPHFQQNNWIYISLSVLQDSLSTMVVERAQLVNDSLTDHEKIFTALPWYKEPNHFGTRMIFKDGYLYVTMGDRYFLRDSAQSLDNHLGKILRIHDDGAIPPDNPYVKVKNAKPEIWTLGHRNPQGLALHPLTHELWEHEHGPKGGDEINIINPGFNFGWPIVCYGIDYDGKPIGEGISSREGLEQPAYYYVPSIAPCGMEFYTGDMFPEWKGSLFIGAMALRHLNRLEISNNKIVREERLLTDKKWRIRNVKQAPDGALLIATDGGQILRIYR